MKSLFDSPAVLTVEKLVSGGLGLARLDGEVLLLPGVLPGEVVKAEVGQAERGVRRGRLLEVLEASPFRTEPDCPVAGICGGCDFLFVEPGSALALKSRAALGDLAAGLGLEIELAESPVGSAYRSRATLHLGPGSDGGFKVGFFNARREVVDISGCRLLAPELLELLPPLQGWAEALPESATGLSDAEINLMKDLDDDGRMIIVTPWSGPGGRDRKKRSPVSSGLEAEVKKLKAVLKSRDLAEVALYYCPRNGAAPRRLSPAGPERLTAAHWPELDLTLTVAPGGFTQVNPAVNKVMVEKILEAAGKLGRGRALDLYSGLGNIALPLVKSGWSVTAVEESPSGAAAARRNGRGLSGFTLLENRSEKAVVDLARQGRSFDLIILDPPRSGAKDLAPTLAALKPRAIIYVACHPAVLKRDLPAFASLGYRVARLAAFDMFPRTSHLEAMAVLNGL